MKNDKLNKIIVIVGPTASGKSDLALHIARKMNGEIISADSRQIYRGMDIGTAKPTKKEMAMVKHYLVDVKNPDEDYSVAQFKHDAIEAIKKISAVGKLPIIVGGTGLYIDAVVKNLDIPHVKADPRLRVKLEKEIKNHGLNYVFKKLIELDPEAVYIVDSTNPRRVIRALEVALISGKPFTTQRKTGKPLFDFLIIGIKQPPDVLKNRITKRVYQMLSDGLVEEVRTLVKKYGSDTQALDAIGYREMIDHLKGKLTLEEAAALIIKNTRHYAKRQMTWFKRDRQIYWVKNQNEALKLLDK